MLNSEHIHEEGEANEPSGRLFLNGQTTVMEQMLRFQREIKGQNHRVVTALYPIAEALEEGGNVSDEMRKHLKAQLFLAHRHLDHLEQWLDGIDPPS